MAKLGGWAGKVLRVNLSTGRITKEDTVEKYKDVLGGTGIGYQVLWDEVKAGTKAFDPENKVIFGVGPLAGTDMSERLLQMVLEFLGEHQAGEKRKDAAKA